MSVRTTDAVRAAMTTDDRLDDLARARMWNQIEEQIEQQLATPASRRFRVPAAWLGGVAVAAAAMIAVAVWSVRTRATPEQATWVAPADTSLSAHLGPHTRATLVGPATLAIDGVPGDVTSVTLRTGTLLAEFEGGRGRALRIATPDAVVHVVGTLFAVEVGQGGTCVSVAHGRVRVVTMRGPRLVGGGEQVCTRDGLPTHSIPAAVERSLTTASLSTRVAAEPAGPTTSPVAPTTAVAPVTARSVEPPHPTAPRVEPAPPREEPTTSVAPVTSPAVATSPPTTSSVGPTASTVPPTAPAGQPTSHVALTTGSPSTLSPAAPSPSASTGNAAAAPATADDLYAAAEAALAAHDLARADRTLGHLVTDFPSSRLVDQALYDRARIAYQQHAWSTARGHLEQLARIPRTPLAEPGRYLACRIAVDSHDGAAAACLVGYRADFPRSPHDVDVLVLLVRLAHDGGGCAAAQVPLAELVRAYPKSEHARTWRERCGARR